jgi:cytochrome b involved in lipid metabolism
MKPLLPLTALLLASVTPAYAVDYTLADVAKHASASDCWMVLNSNQTYNFTAYIASHPGGTAMVPYCGKDGTQAFSGLPHSARAIALQPTYLIGNLVTPALPISVSLSPATGLTTVGGTLQFTPKVANSLLGVAWTVQPASLGTISASGLFTATSVGGGTITAASLEDLTKSAGATITVTTTTVPPPHVVGVTIFPGAVTVNQGTKVRFRAAVTNSTTGVKWTVTGGIGTIDVSGQFTAGATAGTGTVQATSVDDPNKVATAQVTVTTTNCVPATRERHGRDD